jgi:hypothetical protein
MFKKSDERFEVLMADQGRRQKRIAELSRARKWMFGLAGCMVVALCILTVASGPLPGAAPRAVPLIVYGAVMMWLAYVQMESELKLLKLMDALRGATSLP